MYSRIWIRRTNNLVEVFDAGLLIHKGTSPQDHVFAKNVERELVSSGLMLEVKGHVTLVSMESKRAA